MCAPWYCGECPLNTKLGMEVHAGKAILALKGERVPYSTPREGGAEYVAICLLVFSPETLHGDE